MHMLHAWEGDEFRPVTESYITTRGAGRRRPGPAPRPAAAASGPWTRTFQEARGVLRAAERGQATAAQVEEARALTRRIGITRDDRLAELADRYLTLDDILRIRQRILPSGLIGGKAVGMLLARRILDQHSRRAGRPCSSRTTRSSSPRRTSTPTSCRTTSGCCARSRRTPRPSSTAPPRPASACSWAPSPTTCASASPNMLDYFGNSPIIVRSSSLLEDAYGNTFAGKYDSVFCANQGPKHIRVDEFLQAVRRVYASSMSEEALVYREERGCSAQGRADGAPGPAGLGRRATARSTSRTWRAWPCRTTPTSGTSPSIRGPAWCAWSSGSARARSIAPTTTTPASWR